MLREVHARFAAAPLHYGHGTDNAWDEAVALVLGVTGLPDTQSSLDARLDEKTLAAVRAIAGRRIVERRPLAYLLGKTPYCGEMFHLSPGIVVPRSPIGPWLGDGLRPWIEAPERILDLCCGSGCLGILAARRFPGARVVLADIDPLAVATARRNIAAHALEGRVEAIFSDVFAGVPERVEAVGVPNEGKVGVPNEEKVGVPNEEKVGVPNAEVDPRQGFDLILCNPPYVDAEAMAALPEEFAREPAIGLDGGVDGLAVMNRVIGAVSRYLASDGVLIGEVGDAAERLQRRWPRVPFVWPDLPAGGAGVFLLQAADAP